MAPVFAAIGITPQIIDDERLKTIRSSLEAILLKGPLDYADCASIEEITMPLDIERIVTLLEPCQSWTFEEQVDLQEWVEVLNRIDASLSYYIQKYPSLLLIGPVERRKSKDASKALKQPISKPAGSLEDVNSVPDTVRKNIVIILKFLSGLLANSSNKTIFNSVEELVDLLAAADDNISSASLETLCALATPPSLHKQQVPEIQQHCSALHQSKSASHKRLTALARGWGTRGSGLGLYTCAVADDSSFGQGTLPQQAGELNFNFFKTTHTSSEENKTGDDEEMEIDDSSLLVRINLSANNFVEDSSEMAVETTTTTKSSDESDDSTGSKQKRRKVALTGKGGKRVRSTADLFFDCLQQVGGSDKIPADRLFPLLADIRLTRSFYCQATRVGAIERRLQALITILHAHPSQEIMAGYFQAQPELCVELVDLLRPTVSSGAVSAASSSPTSVNHPALNQDSIAALANSPIVPYQVRELALQSLTALAARRDGSNGALAGFARHSNILSELGVGKGQYLGLLPTLIRYSLASLGSLVSTSLTSSDKNKSNEIFGGSTLSDKGTIEDDICTDIGLAFIEASSAPALPRFQQLEKALLFIDSVLTLTSAIVSTPSGTSSLTECGLIPALLNTVSIHSDESMGNIMPESSSTFEVLRIQSLLRFIIAQAVQILEGAIVTHNNALSAFHNLQGVEVLTTRLSKEVLSVRDKRINAESNNECSPMDIDNTDTHRMELDSSSSVSSDVGPRASQRVLLFGIVTCLTVVFHQESTSSSVSVPSGTAEIQKPELTEALIEILDNVDLYGGHLASLISTLLSDVMNSDPHVVRYVHESGLARSFLKMLDFGPSVEPIPPPVPELIMSIPTVLAALALTEDGAKKIKENNPFPGLLKIFYHPKYAMPRSRCLLNEMTSIVGTGLDEIMRHVPALSKLICKAISDAMMEVVSFGEEVSKKELDLPTDYHQGATPLDVDNDRSCLIQYTLNFGQILEQILHNEDHCEPFVESGGLDAILKMYPHLMPTGDRFLAHVSCLSCPSLSTISHSTTEEALTLAFKCISLRYDPLKLIRKTVDAMKQNIDLLKVSQLEMRSTFPSDNYNTEDDFDAIYVLDGLPRLSICDITDPSFISKKAVLAKYLRATVTIQWLAGLLSVVIQASCQRSSESGAAWSRTEREWKKELSSTEFQEVFNCLSSFFQSATFEACRIRTEEGFEEREMKRQRGNDLDHVRYKLRIVCPEGAVVRDGIEIDSCESVGSMEMGEIVESFDRCVNSSGVLRYRTQRGWLSEQTRGHGREPIAEVLAVWKSNAIDEGEQSGRVTKGRIEDGIPDLRSSSANVLARMQTIYVELYSSLIRLALQSLPSLSARHISFQQGAVGWHISTLMSMLSSGITKGFARPEIFNTIRRASEAETECKINKLGVSLYLGSLLSHLQACLFEDKRDKQTVHLPLLISLASTHIDMVNEDSDNAETSKISFFDGIQFIFELCLDDFESRAAKLVIQDADKRIPRQRLNRTTASCLPPATTLLRRLLSVPSITSSQTVALLGKMKERDISILVGMTSQAEQSASNDGDETKNFVIEQFLRKLLCKVSDIIIKPWTDPRIVNAPPHVIHPLSTLVSETMIALEDSTKKSSLPSAAPTPSSSSNSARENPASNIPFRSMLEGFRAATNGANTNDDFEPSEEAISRLMEMGFSRDHSWDAIDRTRSNTLEIAMEYALSNSPSSTESIDRRRAERERRCRQRQEQVTLGESGNAAGSANAESGEGGQEPDSGSTNANPSDPNPNANASAGAMDVDQASSNEVAVTKTEADRSRDALIEMVTSRITSWKLESSRVACTILSYGKKTDSIETANNESKGDAESEALTTVLSSFLLNLCQRHPDDRDVIAGDIFNRLKDQMLENKDGETKFWSVIPGNESSFASLCHCAVLFIRAIPKMRTLLLKEGLVSSIISIITNYLKHSSSNNVLEPKGKIWPIWFPSTLLLLDIMAQPIVAFSAKDNIDDSDKGDDKKSHQEFYQVKEEHKKQTLDLSALAHQLFSAFNKVDNKTNDLSRHSKAKKSVEGDDLPSSTSASTSKNEESESSSKKIEMIFQSVPAYFPLIPSQTVETCADICLAILGDESPSTQPGVTHGALLLLMRLLRNPKMSTYCMKAGAGQKILSLQRSCRFNGHSGLVALIFRRLLEDETTLQSSMETEIRNAIVKLDGKKVDAAPGEKETISVPRKSFLKAITPILCRDPACFLKALAGTTVFEKSRSDSDGRVVLLTTAQRSRQMEIISETLNLKQAHSQTGKVSTDRSRRSSASKQKRLSNGGGRGKSKTPTRSNKRRSISKKDKGESKENNEEDHSKHHGHHTPSISISQQITWLLLNQIIQTGAPTTRGDTCNTESPKDDFDLFGYETSFLWTANMLEILADLVLSIPACATAIHKFKPRKNRESSFSTLGNALQDSPSPPRTFVSFLLHVLLSQDRWNVKTTKRVDNESNSDVNDASVSEKRTKKHASLRTKVVRSTARLLVALVARPGEGRRRVIVELIFALSGGQVQKQSSSSIPPTKTPLHPRPSELHALQSWGELCIGFAAPKSNGSNYESNSSLSFEVIKIMLENGMAHALLIAMHRVPLYHPMASGTVGALILPFEIITRSSVADSVKTIVEKEAKAREGKEGKTAKSTRLSISKEKNSDVAQRLDSFVADDHMLEDAFAEEISLRGRRSEDDDGDDIIIDDDEHDMVDVEDATGMDIEDDIDDEEASNDDDDDEMSSESDSSNSDDDDSEIDDDDDGDDDDDDSDDDDDDDDDDGEDDESMLDDGEESDGVHSMGEFEEDAFNLDSRSNGLVAENNRNEFEEALERERAENHIEEGWTRVEQGGGLGGMVLGRRGIGQHLAGLAGPSAGRSPNRNFLDAAEAMIGTLLRTGEIRSDALSEIENTLGIRIVGGRNTGAPGGGNPPNNSGTFGNLFSRQQGRTGSNTRSSRGLVGALPQIIQMSQPDLGYSTMGGRGNRWNETNPAEYLFGGPCITAGSRHYDLISPVVESEDDDENNNTSLPTGSGPGDGGTQLFPGGVAAATHARTQHSVHPLLGDIDLPPINALVSDLQPHGIRASRSRQSNARRFGEWTSPHGGFFVSNSNGTVVRSNRMMSNTPQGGSAPGSSGPFGWTDHDGPPFDAEQFSSAFENALGETETLLATSSTNQGGELEPTIPENLGNNDADRNEEQPSALTQITLTQEEEVVDPNNETSNENENQDGNGEEEQDGDGVASSLAVGLRLSPPSNEPNGNNDNDQNPGSDDDQIANANANNGSVANPGVQEDATTTSPTETETEDQQAEPVNAQDTTMDTGADAGANAGGGVPNGNGLVCPSGMDPEVFNVLPLEMQQEVVSQAREASELAEQLDATSSLDPEALAALPEDMRREVILQEQQERRNREQAPADPSNAEEMDNASFVASLAPDLRNEILLTADDAFIQSLPPNIVAEAQILRERARTRITQRMYAEQAATENNQREAAGTNRNAAGSGVARARQPPQLGGSGSGREHASSRRKRNGKLRVELDRKEIAFIPSKGTLSLTTPIAKSDLKSLIRFMYLLYPVRPHRILQKVFQNISMNGTLRLILSSTFLNLLNDEKDGALYALDTTENLYSGPDDWRKKIDVLFEGSLQDFPPNLLIGAAPDVLETDGLNPNILMIRRRQTSDMAASTAANLPITSRGSQHEQFLSPVVSTRMIENLLQMCKNSQRFCLDMLVKNIITNSNLRAPTGFESLLDLLKNTRYSKSSANLEQLLNLLEVVVSPLSHIPKLGEEDVILSQNDIDEATSQRKEWVDVPRVTVSQERLQLLCSILRMETCKDTAFAKVNTIARRLCRVDANRGYVLAELASVARSLGVDATRDLTALNIRISATVDKNQDLSSKKVKSGSDDPSKNHKSASTSVAVSTSTSELKLLRVLQTLQSLCAETPEDGSSKRNEGLVFVTGEFVSLLDAMNFDNLWTELTSCLKVVQVLEGVSIEKDADKDSDDNNTDDGADETETGEKKKLENSIAGLLTRFLPSIEAFFVANGSLSRSLKKIDQKESDEEVQEDSLVGGKKLIDFVDANKILLNALVRNNSGLLEKSLRALIQLPRCRMLLDFDVKRHWFKVQVRRLRQHANRRYGSIRLHIRRDQVFFDAYHQLSLRSAEEMRGRLHITFRNEQGVDAGGLSREFFGILAKEIFNPNYALFTSTEDGCTFQPNPSSSVNPDHLSYFRFVGRIVGKAVADGYLLDSHFTRSLYKHMLGKEPTHHDMEAIDPDYYKNLKSILEYDVGDLGLDLTFSIEDHSFGRCQVVDLIPNGRNIPVTEENKSKYVSLVCQNRMTTAISSQIKAYLDGFYELVSKDLIQIFTPRELELLISGLPDIDVMDLKKNTDYNGWKSTDKQIEWFWNILFSLTRNEKAAFMQFVTGSSKVPLAGFSSLPGMRGVQKFSIHKTGGGVGGKALPSAHTCFNSLDLPPYASETELKEKLMYAINEGAVGFLMA